MPTKFIDHQHWLIIYVLVMEKHCCCLFFPLSHPHFESDSGITHISNLAKQRRIFPCPPSPAQVASAQQAVAAGGESLTLHAVERV